MKNLLKQAVRNATPKCLRNRIQLRPMPVLELLDNSKPDFMNELTAGLFFALMGGLLIAAWFA